MCFVKWMAFIFGQTFDFSLQLEQKCVTFIQKKKTPRKKFCQICEEFKEELHF